MLPLYTGCLVPLAKDRQGYQLPIEPLREPSPVVWSRCPYLNFTYTPTAFVTFSATGLLHTLTHIVIALKDFFTLYCHPPLLQHTAGLRTSNTHHLPTAKRCLDCLTKDVSGFSTPPTLQVHSPSYFTLSWILLTKDVSGVSTLPHQFPYPSPNYLDSSDQRRVRGFHISARERSALPRMPLRTKEQALRSWYENDQVTFLDLLGALEQCKDITTEYGLNLTAHEHWRLGDPHKKTAEPDRHDYPIAEEQGIEISPGPDWHKLFRWLISQRALFLPYHTVYLVTDNRDLQSDEVQTTPGLAHWPKVAAWWQERIRYVGPYGELTTVVFVHISADTGLDRVHPTWAGTYVLNACVFLFPTINFGLIDSDCVPVTLFEVQELWWSSTDSSQPIELTEVEQTKDVSSLEHSHKRARSVDTGRDMQQPGPPSKLSRSLSADNLGDATDAATSKPTPLTEHLAEEADYGSSPERSPRKTDNRTPSSTDSSPTRSHQPTTEAKRRVEGKPTLPLPKGVILVSEAFTEINAGLVIVLASRHTPPVPPRVLADLDLDPDEAVGAVVKAYHMHVEAYLATTSPPENVEQWVASGLLGSPLLGTVTKFTVDWCHAWSILGQWSGHVTFPVPASRVWPRHGHLRKILDAYKGRQPNFHKWARPAFEQGALPTLSMLPGEVAVRVLPGDKMYQAMTIERKFMRPALLHGFGTSAKKQLPQSLVELAPEGWLPLAAALFGTQEWQPQWLHHNFLPVLGLRLHAKVPPTPLTQDQLLLLCSLWQREGERGRNCTALQQALTLIFGIPTPFKGIETWERTVHDQTVDILAYAKQAYLGPDVPPLPAPFRTYDDWASWVLSFVDIWQDDETMGESPLEAHCSGLGGGLLSPDRPYDIFLQNHAQIKVYGPSLAMTDNWDAHVTQIGLTKSVHEYAVYQLLSTAEGWTAWQEFLPMTYAHPQMLLTRAIRLINVTRIRPAHARKPHPTWATAIRQIFRCYHPQGKCLYLKSSFPHLVTKLTDCGLREVNIYGFSAGSFTGLALHEILTEYSAFPGRTKVAAIAVPPELMNLATGDRDVTLIHCVEDRLCVWQPYSLMELSYQVVLIEGHPTWSGRAKHSYGHLLFLEIANGVHNVQMLQIASPQVIPHGVRCEGLLRVLSWVSFDLPAHLKGMVSALLHEAGEGNTELHTVAIQGRDIRDVQPKSEAELQAALIAMIPIPGGSQDAEGQLVRDLLAEFLRGFSLRTLLFLLDMVLPQLDAYHAGRHLQHLQPWASVELMQQQLRGQTGTSMHLTYQYEGYAGFHVLQLHADGAPVLLFCAPSDLPQMSPRDLCAAGRLGNLEANVMAGRALLGVMHLPDAQRRCVLLLVQEKILQGGTCKTPEQRAYKRISPKCLDLSVVSLPIAKTFCGPLLQRYLTQMDYLNPVQDWPKPIEMNMTIPILLEDLVFLGDTRSRHELLVFAQANQARLPLAMGLV